VCFSGTQRMDLYGFLIFSFLAQPSYGSGLIFELRRYRQTNEPMIHLFYANVTNNFDIYKLNLNESARFDELCNKAECSINDFESSIQEFLEVDVENDCKVSD